jgi:hypothetical protein
MYISTVTSSSVRPSAVSAASLIDTEQVNAAVGLPCALPYLHEVLRQGCLP